MAGRGDDRSGLTRRNYIGCKVNEVRVSRFFESQRALNLSMTSG